MTIAALTGALTPLAVVAMLAGCGGSGAHARQPPRLGCQAGVRAALARGLPGRVKSRVVSSDPESTICAYRAGDERLTVDVEANPQAYRAYMATSVHQVQANTGLGGAVPRSDYPRSVEHVGTLASWLPRERQLIATNAPSNGGGAFVRVTIHHRERGAPADRRLSAEVARAALSTGPRPLAVTQPP